MDPQTKDTLALFGFAAALCAAMVLPVLLLPSTTGQVLAEIGVGVMVALIVRKDLPLFKRRGP